MREFRRRPDAPNPRPEDQRHRPPPSEARGNRGRVELELERWERVGDRRELFGRRVSERCDARIRFRLSEATNGDAIRGDFVGVNDFDDRMVCTRACTWSVMSSIAFFCMASMAA
jgi:hypothetical protein